MKVILQIVLWAVIVFLGYLIYDSINAPIQFNKVKEKRYLPVVKKLQDIRESEMAFKEVNDRYTDNFDSLVRFIDTAQFTITQRRDTSYLDEKFKKTYGVDKYIQDVKIDTLGHASVKDSLFKDSNRYKTMMYVPGTDKKEKFELRADSLYKNENYIPVFEARVDKAVVLEGQNENLIQRERKTRSVDDVNGKYIKVGSMRKINTNGNWPKSYGREDDE